MIRPIVLSLAAAGPVAAAMLSCAEPAEPRTDIEAASAATASRVVVHYQRSGTTNRLQAISPVDGKIAWASGTGGTYTITTDGGRTWTAGVVPGAETLEFRDVEALSANVAYLLSAGPGDASRIYKTVDGGKHWTLQFKNRNPGAFYDCFSFWDEGRGVAMSDAVNGVFPVIRTGNGSTWTNIGRRLPRPRRVKRPSRPAEPASPPRATTTRGSRPAARTRPAFSPPPTAESRGGPTRRRSSRARPRPVVSRLRSAMAATASSAAVTSRSPTGSPTTSPAATTVGRAGNWPTTPRSRDRSTGSRTFRGSPLVSSPPVRWAPRGRPTRAGTGSRSTR